MTLTVVCFWWVDPAVTGQSRYRYTAEDVAYLAKGVKKHLSVPHEFVCVTDMPDALKDIEGVNTLDIDWTKHVPGTRFVKLMLYRPNGALAGKRVLYLDLDAVPVRSLDPLVDRGEDLVLFRNPNFGTPRRAFYNTSIILHTCGTRPELWTDFDRLTTPEMLARHWGGTDQAWISHCASREEAHWTDKDGVYGAGRLFNGKMGEGVTSELPDNARIVFFPGDRHLREEKVQKQHPWIVEHRTDA